jgi:hypothetical protein
VNLDRALGLRQLASSITGRIRFSFKKTEFSYGKWDEDVEGDIANKVVAKHEGKKLPAVPTNKSLKTLSAQNKAHLLPLLLKLMPWGY